MEKFLTSIKIIQNQVLELEVSKKDFIRAFKHNVGEEKIELYDIIEKAFQIKKGNYVGEIDLNGFYIKKRNHYLDTDKNTCTVKGQLKQTGKTLKIETNIQGVSYFKLAIYTIFTVGYCYMIFASSQNIINKTGNYFFIFLYIIFHSSIIFGLPYFIITNRIKRMKTEINLSFVLWSKIISSIE